MQKIANLYVYTYSFYTTAFFLFAYLEVPLTGVLGCGMQGVDDKEMKTIQNLDLESWNTLVLDDSL